MRRKRARGWVFFKLIFILMAGAVGGALRFGSQHGDPLLTDKFPVPPPSLPPPFCQLSKSRRAGRPSCGKQVLSCQSGARLEQEPTGLNRRQRIPSQPAHIHTVYVTPAAFAQQLRRARGGGAALAFRSPRPPRNRVDGTREGDADVTGPQ